MGRVDAFIGSEFGVKMWKPTDGKKHQIQTVFRLMSDEEAQTHIMYSKKSVSIEWVRKIDNTMKSLKESGAYNQRIESIMDSL